MEPYEDALNGKSTWNWSFVPNAGLNTLDFRAIAVSRTGKSLGAAGAMLIAVLVISFVVRIRSHPPQFEKAQVHSEGGKGAPVGQGRAGAQSVGSEPPAVARCRQSLQHLIATLSRLSDRVADPATHFDSHGELEDALVEVAFHLADPTTQEAMASEIQALLRLERTAMESYLLVCLLARAPMDSPQLLDQYILPGNSAALREAACLGLLLKRADPLEGDAESWKARESGPWCALSHLIVFPILRDSPSAMRGVSAKWGEVLSKVLRNVEDVRAPYREFLLSSTHWALVVAFADQAVSGDPKLATSLAKNAGRGASGEAGHRLDAAYTLGSAASKHQNPQVVGPDGTVLIQETPNEAQEVLLELLHNDPSSEVKVGALDMLLRHGRGCVPEELLRRAAQLSRGQVEVESRIINRAGKLDSSESLNLLADYYRNAQSRAVRVVCITSLQAKSDAGHAAKRDLVLRALRDESALVRFAAVSRVTEFLGDDAKGYLDLAARDPDEAVRRRAQELLK